MIGDNVFGGNVFPHQQGALLKQNEPEVDTYISGLGTALSNQMLSAINKLVVDLKTGLGIDNLSDFFDIFYLLNNETPESALRNLVKRAHDGTPVQNPPFVAYKGYTGDGQSYYIDTNYNPATQGIKYQRADSALGVFSKTNSTASGAIIGANTTTDNQVSIEISVAGNIVANIHQSIYSNTLTKAVTDTSGCMIVTKTGASVSALYHNKSKVTATPSNGAVPSSNIFLLAMSSIGVKYKPTARALSVAFASKSVNDAQAAVINDAITEYVSSVDVIYDQMISDGYNITDFSRIFNRGKLIITFDDGSKSQIDALPVFELKQSPGCFYINSNLVGGAAYMTWDEIRALHSAGMDIQDHNPDHTNLTTLNEAQLNTALDDSVADFIAASIPAPTHLSYPFGAWNALVKSTTAAKRLTGRISTTGGNASVIYKNNDKYALPSIAIDGMTTLSQLSSKLDEAKTKKSACILYAHTIDAYGISTAFLAEIIDYSKSIGLDIITVSQLYELMVN